METCPNCGEERVDLYETERGIVHCGCYYLPIAGWLGLARMPHLTFANPLPVEGWDEPWGVE